MIFRQANEVRDLDTVIRLRDGAKRWLAARGSDQWALDFPDRPTMIRGFARSLANGETWFAETGSTVLGMITINDRTDPGLWTPAEHRSALFIHRLTRDFDVPASRGTAVRLLDFAMGLIAGRGYGWARLDTWTGSDELRSAYESWGFDWVRTVPNHHTPSATCLQRRTGLRLSECQPDTPSLVDDGRGR